MLKRNNFIWPFVIMPGLALAQPVAEPNGNVAGYFGNVEFDLPALCERAPFLVARTHDGTGAPAVEVVAISNGVGSVEVRTDEGTEQFGTSLGPIRFPLRLDGIVNGTEFAIEVECPAEFSES